MAGQWHHRRGDKKEETGKAKGEEEGGGTWARKKKKWFQLSHFSAVGRGDRRWLLMGQEVQRTRLKCLPSVSASPAALQEGRLPPILLRRKQSVRGIHRPGGGWWGMWPSVSGVLTTLQTQNLLGMGRAGCRCPLVPRGAHWASPLLIWRKESADTLRCFLLCHWASQNRAPWTQRLSMSARLIEANILLCIQILNHSFVHLKLI